MSRKLKIVFLTRKRDGALKICESNIISHLKNDKRIDVKTYQLPYNQNLIIQFFFIIVVFLKLLKIYYSADLVSMYAVCNYFVILNPILKKLTPKTISVAFLAHFEKAPSQKGIVQKILEYAWKSFDYYISMSNYSKKQFLDIHPTANIKTVYLGINPKYKHISKPNFLPYKYILYVGDEYKRKNIEVALKAFSKVKRQFDNLMFVKIGRATSQIDAERVDNLITELNISDSVIKKREYISEEDLASYYSNAEFLVSPSYLEGFGLPVIEACKCKCLPLVSAIPTYMEFALNFFLNICNNGVSK